MSFLFELIASSLRMIFSIRDPGHDAGRQFDILCPLMRMAIVFVELFIIAYATAKIHQRGNAIKVLLFKVWNGFGQTDLVDEFAMFSLHLMQKSVAVSAGGLFDLGYSYVCKIFCAVIGYLIITIQFGNFATISRYLDKTH